MPHFALRIRLQSRCIAALIPALIPARVAALFASSFYSLVSAFFSALLPTLLLALPCAAFAQSPAERYPDKPIKIMVPYPADGSVDAIAYALGQRTQVNWGQPGMQRADWRAGTPLPQTEG